MMCSKEKVGVQITLDLAKSSLPWPCSYMLIPGIGTAPSTKACFIEAGFRMPPEKCHLRSNPVCEASREASEIHTSSCLQDYHRYTRPSSRAVSVSRYQAQSFQTLPNGQQEVC